jgi:predicted cobalt transporter CbtA
MNSPFNAILRRGLLAGAFAGLTAALCSLLLVEGPLQAAIEVEEARSHAAGEHSHEEMFSRSTQVVGGMVAAVLVGLALGVIFAVVFATVRHRLSASTDFGRSLQLTAAGFVAVSLLPAVKYPANPPGVGESDTVTGRTLAYFSFIAAGIVILCAAHYLHRHLVSRGWVPSRAATAAAAVGVVLVGVALWGWPANPDPVPADVPATLLWQFRVASLAELAGMWAVLGFSFGLLNEPRKQSVAKTSIATAL